MAKLQAWANHASLLPKAIVAKQYKKPLLTGWRGKFTTVKIAKEEAKEAVSLTGAENNTEAIRLLLEEKRRLEKRRRLLAKAGRIAIEYIRPKDRGRR